MARVPASEATRKRIAELLAGDVDQSELICQSVRLIVEEAGGRVSDFSGKPWGRLEEWGRQTLASNGRVHAEMLRLLKEYASN